MEEDDVDEDDDEEENFPPKHLRLKFRDLPVWEDSQVKTRESQGGTSLIHVYSQTRLNRHTLARDTTIQTLYRMIKIHWISCNSGYSVTFSTLRECRFKRLSGIILRIIEFPSALCTDIQ